MMGSADSKILSIIEAIASLKFKFFHHNIYILANHMNSIYCAQESTCSNYASSLIAKIKYCKSFKKNNWYIFLRWSKIINIEG